MKPDFERAQNEATKLLLQQDINSLYIDVRKFRLPDHIIIESMQRFCAVTEFPIEKLVYSNIDGACLLKEGNIRIILYDDSIENEQRKHWGIAHELGHIFLGHKDDSRKSEIEAHFFAAQLIAPEIVLWSIPKHRSTSKKVYVGLASRYQICKHFNMSYEAATKRYGTLKRRGRYNHNDIDKQLLEKFKPMIISEFAS